MYVCKYIYIYIHIHMLMYILKQEYKLPFAKGLAEPVKVWSQLLIPAGWNFSILTASGLWTWAPVSSWCSIQ